MLGRAAPTMLRGACRTLVLLLGSRHFSISPHCLQWWVQPEEQQQCRENLGIIEGMGLQRNRSVCWEVCGKILLEGTSGCQLMLTRLSILSVSSLVEILRHPKDYIWKLPCKLVPLKCKQTMDPWSNYHQEFSRLFSCYAKYFSALIIIINFLT